MIIDFNENSTLDSEDSVNLFQKLEELGEKGIIINIDVFVATRVNNFIVTDTSKFVNWDESDVTDGVMSVKLLASRHYGGVAYMYVKYKNKYGDFDSSEFNITPFSLRRIIDASNYNGKDPSDVSVIIDDIDGPIPTKNLLICTNGKTLPKSDDGSGIPVYGFDPYTCSYRVVNAIVEFLYFLGCNCEGIIRVGTIWGNKKPAKC